MSEQNGTEKQEQAPGTALVKAADVALSPVEFEPRSLGELGQMAKWIAASGLAPRDLRGKPADVMIVIMFGRNFGLTTMQSLQNIYVVEGRPSMSAALMEGLCRDSGLCKRWTRVKSDHLECVLSVQRKDDAEPREFRWTIEDAKRALLVKEDKPSSNWMKYPRQMLLARCRADAAREVFPEVMSGVYSREEAEEIQAEPITPTFTAPPMPPAAPPSMAARETVTLSEPPKEAPATEAAGEAEPQHDPETGEVTTPTREPGSDDGDGDLLTYFSGKIEGAATKADLDLIAADIGKAERDLDDISIGVLRTAYAARSAALKGSAS